MEMLMEAVIEKYYIHASRLTQRLREIVLDGKGIYIEGEHYVELSEKPKGRSVLRKLTKPSTDERFVILK